VKGVVVVVDVDVVEDFQHKNFNFNNNLLSDVI
jgi:hypothetical protein